MNIISIRAAFRKNIRKPTLIYSLVAVEVDDLVYEAITEMCEETFREELYEESKQITNKAK